MGDAHVSFTCMDLALSNDEQVIREWMFATWNACLQHSQTSFLTCSFCSLQLTRAGLSCLRPTVGISCATFMAQSMTCARPLRFIPMCVSWTFARRYTQCRVVWSPNNSYVYCTSQDHSVCIWEVATQRLVHRLKGHTKTLRDVDLVPSTGALVTGSFDRSLRYWSNAL